MSAVLSHFFLLLDSGSGSGGTYSEILTEVMIMSSTGLETSPVLLVLIGYAALNALLLVVFSAL